jgi:hypothetical protein
LTYVFDYIGKHSTARASPQRFVQALSAGVGAQHHLAHKLAGRVGIRRRRHERARAHQEGQRKSRPAASAATVVRRRATVGIAENALFMIHDPGGFAMGGSDMRATADALIACATPSLQPTNGTRPRARAIGD